MLFCIKGSRFDKSFRVSRFLQPFDTFFYVIVWKWRLKESFPKISWQFLAYIFIPLIINLTFVLSRRYPEDTPKIERRKLHEKLTLFNTFNYHTTTLPHVFMSQFTRLTAYSPKKYSLKKCHFLGDTGVVYNYIHSIYYIFFDRYAIDTFFYVIVW